METTSTLIEIRIITPSELTEEDMRCLEKGVAADCLGQTVENVMDTALAGRATLWRWLSEKGQGIAVTQEYSGTKEKELFVWYIGGKGLAHCGNYASAVLEEFCRLRNLARITAVIKPSMKNYLSRFGYRVDRYLISKEVPNGRRSTGIHVGEDDPGDT